MSERVTTRRATAEDLPAVLNVARAALGWNDADTSFLRWKHLENPFGPSPMWVAEAGSEVVAFRAFLRWEFATPTDRVVRAVRAVDTATAPAYQGQGLFRRLTLEGLEELRADGTELVFNTPNEQSLPGYVAMGWDTIGRIPVAVRPNRWRFAFAVLRARHAAERTPVPSSVGNPAADALSDRVAIAPLLEAVSSEALLSTRRTPAYLAWRYGNPALGYRAVQPGDATQGLALYRLRRRGAAVEAVVCELLTRARDRDAADALVDLIRGERSADYLLGLDRKRLPARGFLTVPRLGPVLACRTLDGSPVPALSDWAFTMGDIELL